MSEAQLYIPQQDGDAKRDLALHLEQRLSDKQLAAFTTQQVLGIANGSLEIYRYVTAPLGEVIESVGPAGLTHNGHDRV